jgi:uncharacterized protein (DUF362 family)
MNEPLLAIAKKVRPRICLLNGFHLMEGNGPMFGSVVDSKGPKIGETASDV